MTAGFRSPPEVFSAGELARASGRSTAEIRLLIGDGRIQTIDGTFVAQREAVRVLRALQASEPEWSSERPALFSPPPRRHAGPRWPLVASTAFHGALIGALVVVPLFISTAATERLEVERLPEARLVFLATPGPGGGGGGGGLKVPRPPARSKRLGENRTSSPVPPVTPPAPVEPTPPEPPKPEEPPEPVVAPVVSVPADEKDQKGVVEETPAPESQGPGNGGGAGTGSGTGLGEGQGSGIGEGSGGGTGGGPYRPGSGIEPPRLLREVKPDYTEEARRRSLEGDVVLEIVVRSDGSVGDIRVVRKLGYGLDDRAIAAVRQWKFSPAKRRGTPVDLYVEVAVEFKLR